jgi:hypothetical protein
MEPYGAAPNFPAAVHLHETVVLDREAGLGLEITVVPAGVLPEQPRELFERLGDLQVVRDLPSTEPALLAALAGILEGADEEEALERMDRLLINHPENPLADIDSWNRRFLEHCAFSPILAVEESPIRPKVLAAMVAGAAAVTVAAIPTAGLVLAIVAGVGTVTLVAAVGPPAVALGERLATSIAGKA